MNLYRIKRNSDGKFYRNKSRFTKFGTYFRKEQLKKNLHWVLSKFSEEDLSINCYKLTEDSDEIKVWDNANKDDILSVLERNDNIQQILKDINE